MRKIISRNFITIFVLVVCLGLGILFFHVVNLTVPVPGTTFSLDPAEPLLIIGSAIGGPLGAIIISLIGYSLFQTSSLWWLNLINHTIAGIWIAFAYRKFIFNRLSFPINLAGWLGMIVVYYFFILTPIPFLYFTLLSLINNIPLTAQSLWTVYLSLVEGILPEFLTATIILLMVVTATPTRLLKPRW